MKKYEKPRLIALSLEGNERLCGDCAEKGATTLIALNKSEFLWLDNIPLVGDRDGVLEESDTVNAFGSGEDCTFQVEGYCKFSGADQSFVSIAWS